MYSQSEKVANGLFGNYFYYNLNSAKDGKYAVFALVNATSQDALAVYGTYIHQ